MEELEGVKQCKRKALLDFHKQSESLDGQARHTPLEMINELFVKLLCGVMENLYPQLYKYEHKFLQLMALMYFFVATVVC